MTYSSPSGRYAVTTHDVNTPFSPLRGAGYPLAGGVGDEGFLRAMSGPGVRAIWRRLVGIALLLALWMPSAPPAPVAAWQTIPLTGEPVASSPLPLASSAVVTLPPGRAPAVWLVEHQAGTSAATGSAGSSLLYSLPRRQLPNMHGEHGAPRAAAPGRAPRLAPGEIIPLYTATTDAAMTIRFTLVPAGALPTGAVASEPFTTAGGQLRLELQPGLLAPGQQITIPAGDTPVVLLAVDNPIQIAQGRDAPLVLTSGALTLLDQDRVIGNADARMATFVVARIASGDVAPHESTAPREIAFRAGDAALDDAWQRFGCALNPGNPACLTVGLAAACTSAPAGPGCTDDSDADSCLDVAEVRAGLDPFEPADCLGSHDGDPLLNCLFLAGNLSCDGHHDEGTENRCSPPTDPRRGPRLGDPNACHHDREARSPDDACQILKRDPACDGFAP